MKIATWNVNSIKVRLPNLLAWLKEAEPDVVCLQELKCVDDAFPRSAIEDAGYNVETHGQKTYNGVALLSRSPMEDVSRGLPGMEDDEQARYIEALVPAGNTMLRVASIYLPNGNPAPGPKYDYKLDFMAKLHAHAQALLAHEEPLVLAGDYNVIPKAEDVHDADAWADDALFLPETRLAFQSIGNLGLTDAFRACHTTPHRYSFWDYQGGAWQKDHGIRIDHLMLSAQAADRLSACDIDKHVREWEKPSDHVPVWAELDFSAN
ncbi:exodeoxyribonuclease III [Pyruvatibacter mobilis]|uniref:exodeoxyribonuclease III n=1 Tax=Pyruvatibacter mobilis TaxID=1712261 RepID=UPI003BA975F3